MNPVGDPDLKNVLDGELAKDEMAFKLMIARNADAKANCERRKAYFKTLNAGLRFHFLNYPENLEDVQAGLQVIAGKKYKVLFIQLGRSFVIQPWSINPCSLCL